MGELGPHLATLGLVIFAHDMLSSHACPFVLSRWGAIGGGGMEAYFLLGKLGILPPLLG